MKKLMTLTLLGLALNGFANEQYLYQLEEQAKKGEGLNACPFQVQANVDQGNIQFVFKYADKLVSTDPQFPSGDITITTNSDVRKLGQREYGFRTATDIMVLDLNHDMEYLTVWKMKERTTGFFKKLYPNVCEYELVK